MEEERRLCYVAITRAKRRLTITSARQRMLYGHTSVNRPSRFLGEIPPELLLEKQAARPQYAPQTAAHRPARPDFRRTIGSFAPSGPTAALPDFAKGDMVRHDIFGNGMILSVLKMGNDAMLEIAFDQVGTKRLMAVAAAPRMKKLS